MTTVLFPVNELRIGGAEQQLLELVRGLDKSRFRPIVAPLRAGGALDGEFRSIPGAEVVDLHRRGKYDFSTLINLGQLLRQRRVDVVQPFLSPATFFGVLPALAVGTPVKVVTERCGVRNVRGFGYKTYSTAEDLLTRFADAVVANSLAGQQMLLKRGIPADRIHVFYNGVNPERLQVDASAVAEHRARLGVGERGQVVGILASLTPAKDHRTFLRSAAMAAAEIPELRVAIVCDGLLRAELEQLAADLGLAERVVFFGNQRRVADFLATFDVLVSSSSDNEGCSNSILEAMLLDVPVVATRIGGNCELIDPERTGYLVEVGDPGAMAAMLVRLLRDATQTRATAARARSVAESRFSLGRMVSDYERLYETLLARRQGRAVPAGGLAR